MIHFFGLVFPAPFLIFAIIAIGIALWPVYQRWKLRQWPVVSGTVEDAWSEDYRGGRSGNVARVKIRYSFTTEAGAFGGEYKRLFNDRDDARIFATGLKGLAVNVHYNPQNPSKCGLLDEDADLLQGTRPPLPPEALYRVRSVAPSAFARRVSIRFMIAAACGFVLATAVNIAGWLGYTILPENFFFAMHVGIFVVFLPAILFGRNYSNNLLAFRKRSGTTQGWLPIVCKTLFVYVFFNFFSFVLVAPDKQHEHTPSALMWRGFSGHWMLFYFMSFALLYSVVTDSANKCRCVNGHIITDESLTCPVCGAARA